MDEEVVASTKSVVLKTRAKREEERREDRIALIEKKIDLLLQKMEERK